MPSNFFLLPRPRSARRDCPLRQLGSHHESPRIHCGLRAPVPFVGRRRNCTEPTRFPSDASQFDSVTGAVGKGRPHKHAESEHLGVHIELKKQGGWKLGIRSSG